MGLQLTGKAVAASDDIIQIHRHRIASTASRACLAVGHDLAFFQAVEKVARTVGSTVARSSRSRKDETENEGED